MEGLTNEEAYRILSNGLVNAPSEHKWCMAFEMGIKALEQVGKIKEVIAKWKTDGIDWDSIGKIADIVDEVDE